jgi:prevent-host-death family protein
MYTLTATDARANLFGIIKNTVKGHLHTRISSKEGAAVIISEEDYESLLETAELLSIKGFKESIRKADREISQNRVLSLNEAFK